MMLRHSSSWRILCAVLMSIALCRIRIAEVGAATTNGGTSTPRGQLRLRKKHASGHSRSHNSRTSSTQQQTTHSYQRQAPSQPVAYDEFPTIADVSEMANLSHLVYRFKKLTNDSRVCDMINRKQYVNATDMTLAPKDLPPDSDIVCHWYRHDLDQGTQVMIVTSKAKDYVAVVFAGTDDLTSMLVDMDIFMEEFGTGNGDDNINNNQQGKGGVSSIPIFIPLKQCPNCKVHAGFNRQVFAKGIFDDIYVRVESLRETYGRFFTTGHSLGAAGSILTALAFALQDQRHRQDWKVEQQQLQLPTVTSLNFGCPMIGNADFEDYVTRTFLTHTNSTHTNKYLRIWRLVLGWDLVPRLPSGEFFYHVGHTVQMHHPECKDAMPWCSNSNHQHHVNHHWWNTKGDDDDNGNDPDDNNDNITKSALAYYHHFGNKTLNYGGVPTGWNAKPYLWVPGALLSHAIGRYATFLNHWNDVSPATWVHDFVRIPSKANHSKEDDDKYVDPPDDDAASLLLGLESTA